MRARLCPWHVYETVERLTGTGGVLRCFFLLLDEVNAVESRKEALSLK